MKQKTKGGALGEDETCHVRRGAARGVSQPTVSRVLNEDHTTVQISQETRRRVMDAVEELGYRPNVIARSLRTRRMQTIALLIADISNDFYHPSVRAVQDVARQHAYEVLISNSDHVYHAISSALESSVGLVARPIIDRLLPKVDTA